MSTSLTVDAQLVMNLLTLLQSFISNIEVDDDGDNVETNEPKSIVASSGGTYEDRRLFCLLFAQAYIWSVGGNVSDKARLKFSTFARSTITEQMHLPFPSLDGNGLTVFDFFVHKKSQSWVPWSYKVPKFTYSPTVPYFDLLVLTTEVVAMRSMMKNLSTVGKHVLVNGVTGTGKSSAVGNFLAEVLRTEDASSSFVSFAMAFSAQTTSLNLQETMEAKLVRRRGDKELGPPVGKKLIMAIDDCNMPQLEQYGAAPPLELIRQVISQGGFYDRKKLFWKEIIDMMFIASCGEPGGGKNEITPRLTSRFHVLCAPSLPRTSMKTIFAGILNGYLQSQGFPANVSVLGSAAVDATLDVYERIASEMLPTPEKTHYTFNLRDVSKVVQGILQILPTYVQKPEEMVKLWAHEASRVFSDRLINLDDRAWWNKCVAETASKRFSNVEYKSEWVAAKYGSWGQRKNTDYREINEEALMQDILKEYQADYNVTHMKDTNLVLFDDAVHHLARICRILRQPRGNALLVGVGGSGRHSLTALASHVCGMACRKIMIVRNYGVNEFREDLRKILLEAGVTNRPLSFLFSDTQIVASQFLEDINNVLNIGEVPGLMGNDEMDKIIAATRDAIRAAGKPETRGSMYQFFVSRCRENLHVIMCMSPVGAQFRDRLRMFPSLVNCMTIDWYLPWPEDALLSVAKKYLGPMKLDGDAAVKEGVCKLCVIMHVSVKNASDDMFASLRRRNFTTPTSYLSLLSSYVEMYAEQRKLLIDNKTRLSAGLETLRGANATIKRLKEDIREMQPVLARSSKEAEEQAAQLVIEQREADVVKTEVAGEEAAARDLMNEATSIENECQGRLDEAMPALMSAKKALDTLSSKDIGEIKTFKTPPVNVEKTMDAVLVLLGEKEGWDSSKKALGKIDFLSRLQEYDKESITPITIKKLQKFINDKDFIPEIIETTSVPCRSLCLWVHAMNKYYHVNREIAPLRERLGIAQGKVSTAKSDLEVKQARLRAVIQKVEGLQRAARETAEKKASLERRISEAQAKLERADQLLTGLSAEGDRWTASVETMAADVPRLVGTILLAAGSVAYVAPFPSDFRVSLISRWTKECVALNVPVKPNFSLDQIASQYKIREWVIQSLPKDQFSIENAVVLDRSQRWTLMIDPQGQANQFIRKREGNRKLRVLKLTDDNYMRSIESAIQVGHPVLIENVGEELDAALDPVLLKQYVKQGTRLILRLGDKEIDYDPGFRLYITTKLPNPTFSPELQIKVTVVNFTVTRAGLEDQQLADIVASERADLQEKSDQCVVAIAEGQDKLKQLEDAILKGLAESTGDILDNVQLIETLKASKATSDSISRDLEDVAKANAEIDAAREKYRPLATRGSLLYGVVAQLSGIDPMYQYSLQFFKQLFVATLQKTPSPAGTSVEDRVQQLIGAVTTTTYNVTCRGLFEKDKLLFSFLLAISFLRHDGSISAEEWFYFLRGSAGQSAPANFPPKPDFVSTKQWNELAALSIVPSLAPRKVHQGPVSDAGAWTEWIARDDLYDVAPPGEGYTEWHRMLLVKALRPEKSVFAMSRVVAHYLGRNFTESPQFSLGDAFTDSSNTTPLIFVLSAGTDPTVLFTTFAQDMGYGEKKLMLSLGQDQGKRAAAMIEEGRKEGLWVYLQNCHVYVSWMSALERIVESIKPDDTHPDFRLWLTSSPSPAFPVPVLQSGMKLTREPPRGLRANIKDSVHSLDTAMWDEQNGSGKERSWKRLVVALCFFHGVVQERRKFGPLGWNIAYEWNQPDLAASIKTIRIALNDFEDLSWPGLQFSIGVLNYGGRVTDFLDSRCLHVILKKFFNPAVLNEGYVFDDEGVYRPIDAVAKDDLLSYIDALPQYETPNLFGLHGNASIAFQAKESTAVLQTIIDLQPRGGGGGGGMSTDDTVRGLAADLAERLPKPISTKTSHPETFKITETGIMNSLGTFLGQEIDQFNRLLRVMQRSLLELIRAIKGEVVMSAVAEAMYTSFLFNQVPNNWKKDGYLCLKPLASYFVDLIERVAFVQKWVINGPPASFWVPGFFFPQGFVTCVFQTHSRLHRMPIDTIKFRFEPLSITSASELKSGPASGVYVHGFYLEGAGWDFGRKCLQESKAGVLHVPLPVIHFDPIPITTPEPLNSYECPLYKTSTRAGQLSTTGLSTNFLLKMVLDAGNHDSDHFVRRGVAALCMLDD
jgi:dynein heavy chain